MKLKTMKRCLAALTSCIIMSTAVTLIPTVSTAAGNIITNSTFDSGTSGWGVYKESGGAATISTENGKLAMKVTSLGSVNYAAQLYYDIVPLYQNGVYRLSFEISSTADRYVEAMIQQNGGTYQAYTWQGLDITSTPQTVDYTFTMKAETDIMSKFCFNCGDQGTPLGEHTIYLDNVVLELVDDSNVDYTTFLPYEPDIMTNQVGYKENSEKIAVFRDVTNETTFQVINADTNAIAYEGSLSEGTYNSSAEETDYLGDFSSVTEPGNYYITCGGLDNSYQFTISEDVNSQLLDDSVKMLYLQRCGCEVVDTKFGHAACHTGKAKIYGTNETIDVSGGWHDAGDYGRYIVPAAKTVADLLYAYEANPELYGDDLGIPDASGNGIPDILDETRYELEWMLKMQASDGGVYHKVSCATFPGYIMPEKEVGQLIVTPVSTTATADFCASMALAYEFYQDIDSQFAETCLTAAEKAWSFLEQNTSLIFENPEDITTGAYNDGSDKDERYWAAAQMYRATGNDVYLNALTSMTVRTGLDWSTVGDYGNIAILTMDGIDTSSTIYTKALNAVKKQADTFTSATESSPYGVAITKFNWGSNMTISNAGIILGLAYDITGNQAYLDAANDNLNYLLGKNPNGVCYVTGYGTVSPQNPHHRPSMAVGSAMPGMLVGGVNSNLEDSAAKAYLINYPMAKRYVDHSESYSTNEITIYWNSPLTYLLSLVEESESAEVAGDVNADGEFNVSDVVAVQMFVLDHDTAEYSTNQFDIINWQAADICSDNVIDSFDLAAMKTMLANAL